MKNRKRKPVQRKKKIIEKNMGKKIVLVRKPNFFFKKNVNPKNFSFEKRRGWTYKDRNFPKVINAMTPFISRIPHFVLKDKKGTPRFVLGYHAFGSLFLIRSIQRERTQYSKTRKGIKWNAKKETKESRKFAEKLGMHPSEFLFSEFLFRNANQIQENIRKTGKSDVFLMAEHEINITEIHKLYAPLIDRFFYRKPSFVVSKNVRGFELSLNKKRVREILGL